MWERLQTIDSSDSNFSHQLKTAIGVKSPELMKWKDVVFRNNNARPHTFLMRLKKFGEVVTHSQQIFPVNYHLFRSFQDFLTNNKADFKRRL